jgi:hypothetical protein
MSANTHADSIDELWDVDRITHEITEGAIHKRLPAAARKELNGMSGMRAKVAGALTDPKPLDICMPVLNAVLAAQYYEVFKALQPPRELAVYEPCVGASPPVIVATDAYSDGAGIYLTINLNRKLRNELLEKIAHIETPVRIVEENAQTALRHLAPDSFDVACFHHAINDILQTAVSEPRGMNTTAIDWFPNERQMIEWLAEDARAGRLESRGKPELMSIIGDAARLVRPGGFLVFDHFNWCRFIGVDWFPWELFYNLIPMTRTWICEAGLPVTEVHLDDLPSQWWMIFRVGRATT